jgi:GABA(A) receptor-associated protein
MSKQEFDFKKNNSFGKRKLNSNRIRDKYPDRIPIIVEKDKKARNLNNIDKNKYLVPYELTLGQFLHIIRQRTKIEPAQSLYLFCGNTLPPTSQSIGNIYQENKDEDGFLYVIYCAENTFG